MKHADAERSIGLGNDDCPFCDHTDEHEHQVKHIRRRDLLDGLLGSIPLTYYPRQRPRHDKSPASPPNCVSGHFDTDLRPIYPDDQRQLPM